MKTIKLILILLFPFMAFGQSGDVSEDLAVVKEPALNAPTNEEDTDEVFNQVEKLNEASGESVEFKPFVYSERGRRNPFQQPGGLERETEVVDAEEELNLTGLEGYDISSFTLTAVMWDVKYPKALVKADENEIYVIEEGTKIGRRNGYVAKIREGEIVIVEPSLQSDEDDTVLYKTQVLKLGR